MKLKALLFTFIFAMSLEAHFLTLLPETDVVSKKQKYSFEASFIHPFEQTGMTMEKPKRVVLFKNSKREDLKIKEIKKFNHKAWKGEFELKLPGDYIIYVDPKEYFEPAEGKFIRHITKTVINGYGMEDGWDTPANLQVEIIPLVKPYGLYKGNTFTGQVLHHEKPAANVEVEVELYNDKGLKAPTDAHITQVVKTDSNGVFSFTMPHSGWWGFAALIEEGEIQHSDGIMYPVEVGGLIWVKAY